MQRLGMWASVYDCAIVLIGHLNKKEGTKGLYRSLGSIDVVAAARSVLQVERDQKDTDIRIVRQIKNSLAPSDGEIRFSITAEIDPAATRRSMATEMVRDVPSLLFGMRIMTVCSVSLQSSSKR